MNGNKSEQDWDYAHWTFRTGTRTFDGVEMLLDNMIINFKDITSHPCGSFSETKDKVARNTISDTAIVMSYALLEGFFSEEYAYYIKKKKSGELSGMINKLLRSGQVNLTMDSYSNQYKFVS
jgi:hypothetical protein